MCVPNTRTVVLVHSGSRGLGESVLRGYVAEHQASGSDPESFAAAAYLQGHDLAVRGAKTNRKLLAERFVQGLGAEADLLWDGCHNSITRRELEGETVWVHRKGAVVAEEEAVMIMLAHGRASSSRPFKPGWWPCASTRCESDHRCQSLSWCN